MRDARRGQEAFIWTCHIVGGQIVLNYGIHTN
jgi:hypothetical protein